MASCILILAESPEVRSVLATCLKANQHNVIMLQSLEAAEKILKTNPPDLVLAEVTDGEPTDLVERLSDSMKADAVKGSIPILLLDKCGTPERRACALSSGARELISWPLDQRLLLARLRGVLREVNAAREVQRRDVTAKRFGMDEPPKRYEQLCNVAFVTARHASSRLDDVDLSEIGANVRRISPEEAISVSQSSTHIDTFVLDGTCLPNDVTINTLPELRAREHSRHAKILFVHDADDAAIAASALDSGASDILPSDALDEELVHRINALLLRKVDEDVLRDTAEQSLKLAATDPLTGLYNRRYAQAYLTSALENGDASELTAMIVDIDHFKRVNDTLGHSAGDTVLVEVANRMRENLRAIDLVARLGGEEFLVVLPGTDKTRAGPAAERLRMKIGGCPVEIGGGDRVRVTVSIGVSVGTAVEMHEGPLTYLAVADKAENAGSQVKNMLDAADKALFDAKQAGRNRIQVANALG